MDSKEHIDSYKLVISGVVVFTTKSFPTALGRAKKLAVKSGHPVCIDAIEERTVTRIESTGHVTGRTE